MALYYTKENLYREINQFRRFLGIAPNDYPYDLISLLKRYRGLSISCVPFNTPGLRGICSFGKNGQDDVILLNSNRTPQECNFDCAHEAIHLSLHRHEQRPVFSCSDRVLDKQNPFLEWHANEGGAELLVPYGDFIPRFHALYEEQCRFPQSHLGIRSQLAEQYNVTRQVIVNRIENLRYEIDQYANGTPIEEIRILSARRQKELGIVSTDYNARCDFIFDWDALIG